MIEIFTERLEITELSAYNTGFITDLLNSPGWLAWIGDRGVKTTEDAMAYLMNGPMRSYNELGFGLYLVKLRETNEAIGICGLLQRAYLPHPDIGFALLPQYEGRGYAYEAAEAILADAAATHGIGTVAAIVTPGNEASLRLLRRLGFGNERLFVIPGENEEVVLLERGREG